jgi:hypothetical protein
VCLLSNTVSYRNRLLLSAKPLAIRNLRRKCRIRQQYTGLKHNSETLEVSVCLDESGGQLL